MRFRIGEIALIVEPLPNAGVDCGKYAGTEVEIVGALSRDSTVNGGWAYSVRCFDAMICSAVPSVLRKRPPRDDLAVVSWESVPYFNRIRRELA